jgi:PPOX class probable F420-dependent enzyme
MSFTPTARTTRPPTGGATPSDSTAGTAPRASGRASPGDVVVAVVTAAAGLVMVAGGAWAMVSPRGFADFAGFTYSEHFLHDAGAFQVGIGFGLLLALAWRDALATTLAAFLVANTLHAYNHAADLDLGGRPSDAWGLAAGSLAVAAALVLRLRRLGYVVGRPRPATHPALLPFVEQKTVALTTFRRDGSPVRAPVSLAVDGARAVFRTPKNAGKVRRLRSNPLAQVAPCTSRGTPTGPAIRGTVRRLEGDDAREAAWLLRTKHPLLHGVLVPATHRLARTRTGRTVHYELIPAP